MCNAWGQSCGSSAGYLWLGAGLSTSLLSELRLGVGMFGFVPCLFLGFYTACFRHPTPCLAWFSYFYPPLTMSTNLKYIG